jgi:hypothetical protein
VWASAGTCYRFGTKPQEEKPQVKTVFRWVGRITLWLVLAFCALIAFWMFMAWRGKWMAP